MTENFDFNAPQFVDFCSGLKEEDIKSAEAYFEIDHEQHIEEVLNIKEIDNGEREIDQEFFSIVQSPYQQPMATFYLENRLRKSLSTGNIVVATEAPNDAEKLNDLNNDGENLCIEENDKLKKTKSCVDKQSTEATRKSINKNANERRSRSTSRERSTQAKPVKKPESYHSLAETFMNFQKGFRTEQTSKSFHIHTTIAQSPVLKTKQRARPTEVLSKVEQEKRELEEVKKYKIKAKPLNTKILHGPIKPQLPVERKAPTVVEPFNITAPKQQVSAAAVAQEGEAFKFRAKPVPKVIYNPPKIPIRSITPPIVVEPPKPVNRIQKHRSLDRVDRSSNSSLDSIQSAKQATHPTPFSFEERDKQLKKKKEDFINKVFEEEKKAREFHARPPPKYLQQQTSQSQNSRLSLRRTASHGEMRKNNKTISESISPCVFKARPPSVLYMKPFEPKPATKPLTEITEFSLNTDKRVKEREAFAMELKKKEEQIAQLKKEDQEKELAEEQKQIAFLRKQAEHKANPVRHYKEIVIKKSDKITVPISPKFLVDTRIRNKENIDQQA